MGRTHESAPLMKRCEPRRPREIPHGRWFEVLQPRSLVYIGPQCRRAELHKTVEVYVMLKLRLRVAARFGRSGFYFHSIASVDGEAPAHCLEKHADPEELLVGYTRTRKESLAGGRPSSSSKRAV